MFLNTHTNDRLNSLADPSRLSRRLLCLGVVLLFFGGIADVPWRPTALAAAEPSSDSTGAENSPDADTSTNSQAASQAKMVLGLEESLKRDSEALETLRTEYDNPDNEYHQAQAAFEAVRREVEELEKQVKEAGDNVSDETVAALESANQRAALAEQRFENAFEERRTLREKISALEQTLVQSKESLARLRDGETPPPGQTNVTPVAATGPTNAADTSRVSIPMAGPAAIVSAAAEGQPSTPQTNAATPSSSDRRLDETKELIEARQVVAAKQEDAREAERDLELLRERYVARKGELESAQKLIESAKKKSDVALQERSMLEQELETKRAGGASAEVLGQLEQQIQEATARVEAARKQLEEQEESARELQQVLVRIDELEQAARQAAEAREKEVDKARAAVSFLENPLHPQNLLRWAQRHGPKLIGIVLLIALASLLIRILSSRIIGFVARKSSHGSVEERENRAQTLVSVFRSSASLTVIAGGAIMILEECGVPIGPLLGGAAIVGLAIAFGAQRLIGDFFHGFVILLENQYQVNDVIRVAGIAGLVERITLRVTVLRDLEGCVHFVPNGEIKAVTNMTHGWSRAVFDIGVAYKEDADRVIKVLNELAKELRQDPKYSPLILDEPQMLGLDAMADSAIVIKFMIKTKPLQQWTVRREMLLRIKRRFDELGIEIPFPHRTVYLRHEGMQHPASDEQ